MKSMTGFARHQGQWQNYQWGWEFKSVNGRGKDIKIRLPAGWEEYEPALRDIAHEKIHRGNVSVVLDLQKDTTSEPWQLNGDVVDQIRALKEQVKDIVDPAPIPFHALVTMKGVLDTTNTEIDPDIQEKLIKELTVNFDQALEKFIAMRQTEGDKLKSVFHEKLKELEQYVTTAQDFLVDHPQRARDRLQKQLAEILQNTQNVTEERLAQEIALMMTRLDVREELDRLKIHIRAVQDLIDDPEKPVGRRLDFLCQELNREANTLCSKASEIELTNIGVEMKVIIDQIREQSQNVE